MVLSDSIAKPGIPFQLYKLELNVNRWLYSPLRGNLLHYPVLASSNGWSWLGFLKLVPPLGC